MVTLAAPCMAAGFRFLTLSHDSCSLINHLHKCCAGMSMHTGGNVVNTASVGRGTKSNEPTRNSRKGKRELSTGLWPYIGWVFFPKDSGTLILIGQPR